jgi:predicted HTH domain antitoxin
MQTVVSIECPPELLVGLQVNAEKMRDLLKSKAAIALFSEGRLSSGLAARWLNIPRTAFLLQAMAAGAELLEDSADDFQRETSLL